jgi:hypothetical protein
VEADDLRLMRVPGVSANRGAILWRESEQMCTFSLGSLLDLRAGLNSSPGARIIGPAISLQSRINAVADTSAGKAPSGRSRRFSNRPQYAVSGYGDRNALLFQHQLLLAHTRVGGAFR